ncbi:SAM-dependent methyltransferase [Calothrix rhizosoleniae]|uniref:SAM-dependent methyltransferase n=1 Tax=Calothrix rhizosoleniae TaxID=888997 RepID=UPI000B4A1CDC|nr:SAM-dependent methyltransferase [Calothrix rhizosoleniae]
MENELAAKAEKIPEIKNDVCRTAVVMAAKRAIESERTDRLFEDPFAAQLVGFKEMQSLRDNWDKQDGKDPKSNTLRIQFVAVRTKFFDDFLVSVIPEVRQIVILGVGYDTRAYRLPLPPEICIYEIDLPEIMSRKEEILKDIPSKCHRQTIATDLQKPWVHLLKNQGYKSNEPTVWLMEGLLMYLDEKEVNTLLQTISDFSVKGSYLGVDLISVKSWEIGSQRQNGLISKNWRFGTDEPEELFACYGWNASVIQPGEMRANYGRYSVQITPRSIPGMRRSFMVTAKKE